MALVILTAFSLSLRVKGAVPKSFESVFYSATLRSVESAINPFLGTPSFFGNNTNLLRYAYNLFLFNSKDS